MKDLTKGQAILSFSKDELFTLRLALLNRMEYCEKNDLNALFEEARTLFREVGNAYDKIS